MKKLFTILCAGILTLAVSSQTTDAGTFYFSLGNAYSPANYYTSLFKTNGMNFGSEWVTGITVDGDDDDDNGNDYWDKDQKSKISNFNLAGQFGYFIANGLLAGLGIEYGSFSDMSYQQDSDYDGDGRDDERTSKTKMNSLAFSPFAKYYIPVGNNALFISSSYTFGSLNQSSETEFDYTSAPDQEDDEEGEPVKTSRLEFGSGMAFFLTENISLEPSVNYALNTYSEEIDVYIFSDPFTGNLIFEDQERKTSTNAFYFKIAASMYF
jgi:hypothetical protein